MPHEHEYTVPASRPSSPPPCAQPASDSAQPATQELPNRPNLAELHLNQQLAGPQSPQTRSVDLGFEIRGFSCPRHRRSPKKPHVTNFTKQAYQTNPIPTSSDNALAPATRRPPPPVTQKTHPPKSAKPACQTDPISVVHEISRPTNQQQNSEPPPPGDCHSSSRPHSINNGQPAIAAKMS